MCGGAIYKYFSRYRTRLPAPPVSHNMYFLSYLCLNISLFLAIYDLGSICCGVIVNTYYYEGVVSVALYIDILEIGLDTAI